MAVNVLIVGLAPDGAYLSRTASLFFFFYLLKTTLEIETR